MSSINKNDNNNNQKQNGAAWCFGKPHPNLQTYQCDVQDYSSLLKGLPKELNPLCNWNQQQSGHDSGIPKAEDVSSWFRNDHHVFFYDSPPTAAATEESRSLLQQERQQRAPLSYAMLQKEICKFPHYNTTTLDSSENNDVFVVGVLLPPAFMAEMAVVLMTLLYQHSTSKVCVAPIDPNMAWPKIMAALEQLQCTALVTTDDLYQSLLSSRDNKDQVFDHLQDIRLVRPAQTQAVGVIDWTVIKEEPLRPAKFHFHPSNQHQRPALLLRTSGTTSTPKLVPITAEALLFNATCIAASLELSAPSDIGCNVMPLFHIGGISCGLLAVLVSGTSTVMVPGPFDAHVFLNALCYNATSEDGSVVPNNNATTESNTTIRTSVAEKIQEDDDDNNQKSQQQYATPTWYYGVPSMHKALILTAKAAASASGQHPKKMNQLRFIRSGAAHLPHATAVELAQVFQTNVIPTYSMSECMPVCSSHDAPVVAATTTTTTTDNTNITSWREVPRPGVPDDTVGVPIGSSLAILNEQGNILPYGQIGEVALKGPGVISSYIGLAQTKSHTSHGWFRTGDMGQLDTNGRLVLSGRTKEMIKRGGDQVWPNEVDGVVESVPGIRLAVTFGVANELWGEEAQVAVVLDEGEEARIDKAMLEKTIAQTCQEKLGPACVPSKVHYVASPDMLLKGSTGKFLRTKMADHLGAQPVDTGALRALEAMATISDGCETAAADVAGESKSLATPSSALNGVRFLTACFVVQHHVGLMPNIAWLKIQSFTLNMTIFFLLGAFQLTASVKSEVKSNSAQFIGTKIGSMHSLFIVSQVIAVGSWFLFECGENGYAKTFDSQTCTEKFDYGAFIWNTLTGMGPIIDSVNGPSWFQCAFYLFLIIFPVLDFHLRGRGRCYKNFVFWLNLFIASVCIAGIFSIGLWFLNFFIVSWLPVMVAGMIAAYWFSEYASLEGNSVANGGPEQQRVGVALSDGCMSMLAQNYELARPGEPLPGDTFEYDGRMYVGAVCDLTYDEFVEYVHNEPYDLNNGRWITTFGSLVGFYRLGTPLVLLWLFGLAYGRGLTAWTMKSHVMQVLAPFAYPLYLLHLPISRLYWVATRGHEAEFWWDIAPQYPVPVEWYELFVIIGICLLLAVVLDRFVVQYLSPYTIGFGIKVCRFLGRFCCCCCPDQPIEDANPDGGDSINQSPTLQQVERLVRGLTGTNQVDRSTQLKDLGLDSLGATALLGTLRAVVRNARSLTLAQLASCATVGDLVDLLEEDDSASTQHVEQRLNANENCPPV